MTEVSVIASGLRFPEGPIAMPDGSVVLVEIERGTLSRVSPSGDVSVIAELGGGPNGAAIGPDGRCYVCNNGGFQWHDTPRGKLPGLAPADFRGGSIQAVDLHTGAVETLYTESDRGPLNGPNDIVFDATGGFWFTDLGKTRETTMDRGSVCYARIDGSHCRQMIRAMVTPNGVGLSPGDDELYVAETIPGRIWAWPLSEPGQPVLGRDSPSANRGRLVFGAPGFQEFDSLAIDAAGNVCVATIHNGGITIADPRGAATSHIALGDPVTTNICFGGEALGTAYATLSSRGELVRFDWPNGAGLPLHFLNR